MPLSQVLFGTRVKSQSTTDASTFMAKTVVSLYNDLIYDDKKLLQQTDYIEVKNSVIELKPAFCVFGGHGTAFEIINIVDSDVVEQLAGSVIWAMSCSTANQDVYSLSKIGIDYGIKAYIGYTDLVMILWKSSTELVKGFYECLTAGLIAFFTEDVTLQEAIDIQKKECIK